MSSVVWSTELLALLKAPPTPANYRFLNQWATREHNGGPALNDGSNNPFFTTAGAGGTVGPLKAGTFPSWNSIGVARYPNLEVGVFANAYHIGTEYPAIRDALRSGNPASMATNPQFEGELTRWSGGGYSGFQTIPAAAGPVGPSIDTGRLSQVGGAILKGSLHSWTPGGPLPKGSIAGGAASAAQGAVGAVTATGKFLGKLTDPHYILRGLQIVAGAGMAGVGLVLLARQVALAADVPVSVPGPAAAAASATGGAPAAAVE